MNRVLLFDHVLPEQKNNESTRTRVLHLITPNPKLSIENSSHELLQKISHFIFSIAFQIPIDQWIEQHEFQFHMV